MKPARSFERITCRPSASRANVSARAAVSGAVRSVGTSSMSRSTGTGLKKCMPIMACGRSLAMASFMIRIEQVLEARTAAGSFTTRPSRAHELSVRQRVVVGEEIDSAEGLRRYRYAQCPCDSPCKLASLAPETSASFSLAATVKTEMTVAIRLSTDTTRSRLAIPKTPGA